MTGEITTFRICRVESVHDEYHGQRIKARVLPEDRTKTLKEIPYAFPLLPKMMHVVPKIGEAVLIICSDLNNAESQRYYIGPIISQPQFMEYDNALLGATSLLNGSVSSPLQSLDTIPEANGALPKDDNISLVGRGVSDIVLGDDDVRIRCGVKTKDENEGTKIVFNKTNPSYIKLKQHDTQLDDKTSSSVSIVGENINLLSTASKQYFDLTDNSDLITDKELNRILQEAHVLPYGDVLVKFLKLFLRAFNTHTHAYSGLPPVQDENYIQANNFDMNTMLSDNVRIN